MNESWRDVAAEELEAAAQAEKAKHAERRDALIAKAERSGTPTGQYLKSKNAKRMQRQGREKIYVSLPLGFGAQLRDEADECRISYSNLIASLISIAFPIWQEYKRDFIAGTLEQTYIPMRAKSIFVQAANAAMPKSKAAWNAWHAQVEAQIIASRINRKPPKLDPTEAMLRGMGLSKKDLS